MLLGFANWDTLPTEAAVKAEAKQEASWRQSGLSLNKTKETQVHNMIPNLFLICKNLCQDWSVTEAGVRWGEVRPRSCKLLNCSNLPVMAAAQSGGWTHAMHSSTFGSELGGREGGTGVFTFPHCSRGLQLWCVGYYNASCLPRPILGQLLKEMGHFSWQAHPLELEAIPVCWPGIAKLWIAKFANWQRGSQMVWEFERQQLQICNSLHIFFQ